LRLLRLHEPVCLPALTFSLPPACHLPVQWHRGLVGKVEQGTVPADILPPSHLAHILVAAAPPLPAPAPAQRGSSAGISAQQQPAGPSCPAGSGGLAAKEQPPQQQATGLATAAAGQAGQACSRLQAAPQMQQCAGGTAPPLPVAEQAGQLAQGTAATGRGDTSATLLAPADSELLISMGAGRAASYTLSTGAGPLASLQLHREQPVAGVIAAAVVPAAAAAAVPSSAIIGRQSAAVSTGPILPPPFPTHHPHGGTATAAAAAAAGVKGAAPEADRPAAFVAPAPPAVPWPASAAATAAAAAPAGAPGSAPQPGLASAALTTSWVAGSLPWRAAAPGAVPEAPADDLLALLGGAPWQPPPPVWAADQSALQAASARFSTLSLDRELAPAAGYLRHGQSAGGADGSERASKRRCTPSMGGGNAAAGYAAADSSAAAASGPHAQHWQHTDRSCFAQQQVSGPGAASGGGSPTNGGGRAFPLPLGGPAGCGGPMPSVCPFPGATGSFNGAASAPLAAGAALFNASAAASGQTPFSAGRPPSTARKSTKKVRKRGDLVATCQPCQPCRLQPTPFFARLPSLRSLLCSLSVCRHPSNTTAGGCSSLLPP
jgi:hypothetical protein